MHLTTTARYQHRLVHSQRQRSLGMPGVDAYDRQTLRLEFMEQPSRQQASLQSDPHRSWRTLVQDGGDAVGRRGSNDIETNVSNVVVACPCSSS